MKALALLSGGLDSSLAIKLLCEQDIEITAINIGTRFGASKMDHPALMAQNLGVQFIRVKTGDDYIDMLKNPKHGYGSNFNPCIDCHIYMLRKAKDMLDSEGASFVITGEVLGQRPMSQNKGALIHIEKDAGLEGLLLRPLSAKRLRKTTPECEGWVDRERLLDIEGRGRKIQLELATRYGLDGYSAPAGGCLLTNKEFSGRLKSVLRIKDELTDVDIKLLKVGRHFYRDSIQIIVGRNHEENLSILEFKGTDDCVLRVQDIPGPVTVVRGAADEDVIEYAASLTAQYAHAQGVVSVECGVDDDKYTIEIEAKAED